MAFEVMWSAVDAQMAESIQSFVNKRISNVNDKPKFLGDVVMRELHFGHVAPEVNVIDFTTPRPEFYAKHQRDPKPEDMQLTLDVMFSNCDVAFSISTELILNFPTPSFMSIPISLALRRLSLQGQCYLVLIDKTVHFCFEEGPDGTGPRLDIQLESQVGDQDRHALRNVDRIELFVVEQLRRLLVTHVVFPNFVTVPLSSPAAPAPS